MPKGGWEPSDVQLEAAASREAFEEGPPRFPFTSSRKLLILFRLCLCLPCLLRPLVQLCAILSMLPHINSNSGCTRTYQPLFGHDTDAIVNVSLLRDGHCWTRAGLAREEGTES